MSAPIKKRFGEIAQAPTPQNTPSSLTGSYLKNNAPIIPTTISEEDNEELRKKLLNNPVLLSMIQGKLNTLINKDSGYVEKLPKPIKNRVFGLKSIQQKQFKLEAEFQSDLLELEKKYQLKYKPLYDQRKKIISGDVEPTQDEIEEGHTLFEEEEEDDEDDEEKIEELKEEDEEEEEEEEEEEAKGIPGFWLTALENIGPIAESITERDTEVLASLLDIRMEHLSTPGFKLIFEFDKNDFFANSTLTKTYYYQKELSYAGDFIYDHAEGSNIEWLNNEQNVTITVEKRRQRNKHTKQVRTIEKITPIDSFFNFFNPPKAPKKIDEDGNEEDEEDEVNKGNEEGEDNEDDYEDEDEDIEEKLQIDYEIGELIKDKLIPRAVDWFTGIALQYEFEGDEEYEEDEDDYDDEDDEDDDDEDDEDDDEEEGDDDDSDEDSDDDDDAANAAAQKTQPPECKPQ